MRESEVERQFVEVVRAAGGQALKFTSQSMNGVPDRLVLLLGGKCAFVELKAPGKQMRLLQRKRRQQLEARRNYSTRHWSEDPGDAGGHVAAGQYTRRRAGKRGDAKMKFIPHDYQRFCTEYIKTHPIAALFLDMGLG